jgi:hypothetical protein
MKLVIFTLLFCSSALRTLLFCSTAECSSPAVTASRRRNGLGTGLGTTIKYVRRTTSGAAGNGLGTTIKHLRCRRNGAAGNGLETTIKYL